MQIQLGHYKELFACIENEAFSGRPDQCLAVAYRTISRELYGKDAGSHLRETLRGIDKGSQPFQQVALQAMLDAIDTGNEAARLELKETHNTLSKALASFHHSVLSSAIYEFDGPLPFMFGGAWSPLTDLGGHELQTGYVDELLEQVVISSFAGNPRAIICLSWRDTKSAPGKLIAEQLGKIEKDYLASVLLQFALKHIENVFFSPDWFEELTQAQKKRFAAFAADGTDFMGSVPEMRIDFHYPLPLPRLFRSFRV